MKKFEIFFVVGILIFLVVALPTVSAFEFDNVKGEVIINENTSSYGKVEIRNTLFGIPFFELDLTAEIELLENSDYCYTNCYAEGVTTLYDSGRLIDSLRFEKITGKEIEPTSIYEYKIFIKSGDKEILVDTYSETCINTNGTEHCYNVVTGTKSIYEPIWEEYNEVILEPGKYFWRIEGKKNPTETVDWLGTFLNVEISEWALWGDDNGLVSYYSFDENTGTTAFDNQSSNDLTVGNNWDPTGILGTAKIFDAIEADYGSTLEDLHGANEAMTFNFWINKSGANWTGEEAIFSTRVSGSESGLIEMYGSTNAIVFKAYYISGGLQADKAQWPQPDNGLWTMVTGIINSTSVYLYIDGNYVNHTGELINFDYSSRNLWVLGAFDGSDIDNGIIDEFGIWNRSLTEIEITDLYNGGSGDPFPPAGPTINLTFPINESYTIDITELKYTIEGIGFGEGYCWYTLDDGATNSSPQTCGANWSGLTSNPGSNTWTVWVNDSINEQGSSTVTFFKDTQPPDISLIFPTNITYTTNVSDLNYTTTDALGLDSCWYTTDDGATNSSPQICGTNWSDVSSINGSTNTWTVWVNDSIDNQNSVSVTFIRDEIGPLLNITYPLNDTTYAATVVGFNFTYTEYEFDTCWYSDDDGATNTTFTCGTNVTTSSVEGSNQWWLWANDTGGQEGASNVTFFVNRSSFEAFTFPTDKFETDNANFTMNISYLSDLYTIDAKLNYNGTEFSVTKDTDDGIASFSKSMGIPEITNTPSINVSFFWNVSLTNGSGTFYLNNSVNQLQINVTQINFSLCDAGNAMEYVNYSFKDQDLDTLIEAEIPSSTFDYWVEGGTGDVKKQLLYSRLVDTPSYTFCFEPNYTNITLDIEILYRQLPGFIQQVYTVSDIGYTNISTAKILYLTGTANGAYVTMVVQDTLGNPISEATMVVERQIGGAWSVVGNSVTDDVGAATFYLDQDLNHRFTITHDDYVTEIIVIRPTQPIYTVQLNSLGGDPSEYNFTLAGIRYWKSPASGTFLTPGNIYNFTFDIIANLTNLVNYTFRLVTSENEILNQASGSNAAGGNISFTFNVTANYSYVYTKYYIQINDGGGLYQIDPSIFPIEEVYVGDTSLLKWFQDFNIEDANPSERFDQLFWFFFVLFLGMASFTKFSGAELSNPGICIPIILLITWIASFGGFLTVNINPSVAYTAIFINQFGIALMMTLLSGGYTLGIINKT